MLDSLLAKFVFRQRTISSDDIIPSPIPEEIKYIRTYALGKPEFKEILDKYASQEILIYFCIQEINEQSSYNLVIPVIEIGGKIDPYYFNWSCYALQGNGGGLTQVQTIFQLAQELKRKGGKVSFEALVCLNNDLSNFYTNVKKWPVIKRNSVDLKLISNSSFESINKQYNSLLKEYAF